MALKLEISQMSVTAMMSSQLLSSNTRSTSLTLPLKSAPKSGTSRRQRAGIVRASGMAEPESTGTGGSGIVDSNMMVLRKRIQSLQIQESNYELPAEWQEWERSAYAGYRADVCLLLSTLQSQLLTLRPGTALTIFSVLMAVLPVASLLFLAAVGTQLWSLNCALLDLIPSQH